MVRVQGSVGIKGRKNWNNCNNILNKMYLKIKQIYAQNNTQNVEHTQTKRNVYLTEWLLRERDERIKTDLRR